jgi:hypothetical protein
MGMKVEFELSDHDLHEQVGYRVKEAVEARLEGVLEESVSELVQTRLRELTDEALRKEMDRVLAEGWRKTNSYGEPTGDVVTLKSWILQYLTKSDYGRTPMEKVFSDVMEREMKSETGAIFTEVKVKLRAMVDKEIATKLRAAVSEAIGAKP